MECWPPIYNYTRIENFSHGKYCDERFILDFTMDTIRIYDFTGAQCDPFNYVTSIANSPTGALKVHIHFLSSTVVGMLALDVHVDTTPFHSVPPQEKSDQYNEVLIFVHPVLLASNASHDLVVIFLELAAHTAVWSPTDSKGH